MPPSVATGAMVQVAHLLALLTATAVVQLVKVTFEEEKAA